MTANAADTLINERDLSKLKWRCRRGLLENDLFIERFFGKHERHLTEFHAEGLRQLMDLSDNDLLDLMLARKEPADDLDRSDVRAVLALMRVPQHDNQESPEVKRNAHDPV